MNESRPQQTGFVALSGRPNVGKSTLLNAILGQEISIVSPKPQTTRNRIIGIHNLPGAQIILIDTPGLHRGRTELGRRMKRGAEEAASDADVVVRVVDASRLRLTGAGDEVWELGPAREDTIVALNKVDLVRPKHNLLPMIERLAQVEGIGVVVPISAKQKSGIERLIDEIVTRLPEGPELYPPEMVTDRPERFLAAELVRAAVLRLTREEVPHASAVEVTAWRESPKGVHIEASLYVEKISQKSIIIGRGGEMVKRIGTAARAEIRRVLGCEVHLKLRAEVAELWRGDPAKLRELGYDE